MRIGSLFSGYGGLDLACEAYFGATTAWVSDIDKGACKVLAHRFPDAPNLGDITTINWADVEPVDIIAGGSPCTDLSTAGKRAGMTEGTRSNLWVQMREAIATIRPTFVAWENVRGALSATAASAMESDPRLLGNHPSGRPVLRALGRVVGDLADLGYDAQWCGLRASDVGASHQRFRVFLLGHLAANHDSGGRGRGLAAVEEPRSDGSAGRTVVAHSIGGGCDGWTSQSLWGEVGRAVAAWAGSQVVPDTDREGLEGRDRAERAQELDPWSGGMGHARGLRPASWGCPACGGIDADCATCNLDIRVGHGWGPYEPVIRRWEYVTGRGAPSATVMGKKTRARLSPRFTEWMMGLPTGWIVDVPGVYRIEGLRMAGNGVVPQQALAALTHLGGVPR